MKEQDLDKYLNKHVEITDFENEKSVGCLYKIIGGKFKVNGIEQLAAMNKGYILDKGYCFHNYRKSHIKKIKVL